VVLDTNLVLSALLFGNGFLSRYRHLWQQNILLPLISRTTAAELIRVLGYPKFKLTARDQQELLADYLPWCESVDIPNPPPVVPLCRDRHDEPFLLLASSGNARYLISGDRDLLHIDQPHPCHIISPSDFLQRLDAGQPQ
jgi:uncharacterized protein